MSRKKTFNEFKDDFLNRWGSDKYVFDEETFIKDVLISEYGCSPDDTEHNFCFKQGWYRIYDCGTMVYKWKSTQ